MLVFCSASRKRHALLLVEALHDLEDLLDELRREAHRRLVEQDHLRAAPSARGRSRSSAARRRRCSRTASRAARAGAGSRCRPSRGRALRSARPIARVYAPVSRFSSTVRCWKQCRPSITWHTPRRTSSAGVSWSMRSPSNSIDALGHVAALGAQQVRDRLQRGGLARAVGAEQRDDAAPSAPAATRPSARG